MRRSYIHLQRFPVQRRVMQTPSLAQKPLALVENVRGHLRVAFASTAALKAGVRVGMTRTAACALVPELPCFDYDPAEERAALGSLGEALLQCGPQFQLSAPDGLFLDAAAAHLFGGEEGLCRRVLEVCQTHGYRAKVALASDAFTARALGRHGAARVEVVPPHESARALAPLPLSALGDVEAQLVQPLRALGLGTLGEVATLPPGAIVARLGAEGLRGHRLCRGEDDTPFVAEPLAEVLEEQIDLDWPAEAMEPLLFGLKTLLDRLCGRLCGRARAAVRLELRLRLDPTGEQTVGLQLSRPTSQARLLIDLARHRISDLTLPNPVVGLAVRVLEASEDHGQQLPLGDGPQGDAALEVVLSRLTTTLGEEALFAAEPSFAHRPEGAWTPAPFRPPERHRGLLDDVDRQAEGAARVEQKERARSANGKYVHGPLQHPVALPIGAPRGEVSGGRMGRGDGREEEGIAAQSVDGPVGVRRGMEEGVGSLGAVLESEGSRSGRVISIEHARSQAGASGVRRSAVPAVRHDDAPSVEEEAVSSPGERWPRKKETLERAAPPANETFRERPPRFFGRAATLEAEVGQEGELVSARLLGKRRRVQAVAGPERLTGDWWEAAYERDYYRVYFEGLGPAWIYRDERDGRFYLHGMFD